MATYGDLSSAAGQVAAQGHRGLGFSGGFPIGLGVSQAGGNLVGTQAGGDSTMGRPGLRLRSLSVRGSGEMRSRHGSMQRDDEPRSAARRARSRDHTLLRRRDPDLAGFEADVRLTPAGPQETLDWLQALEAVYDRIEVLERNQSLHAGTMSHTEVKLTSMTGKIKQAYEYLDGRVDVIQDSTNSRMKLASETITKSFTQITEQIAPLDSKWADLESQMQLLDGEGRELSRAAQPTRRALSAKL